MNSTVQELKLNLRLVYDNKEVQTLQKIIGLQETEQPSESEPKSLDDLITDFLDTAQNAAKEAGYLINKESINKATIELILCLIKQTDPEMIISIKVSKEEKENGDSKDSNS